MILPWRQVTIDGGPPVNTSLTSTEGEMLRELARGRHVLEIGSAYGYSAIVMAQTAESVTAVDPHEGYGAMPGSLDIMRGHLIDYDAWANVTVWQTVSSDALATLALDGRAFGLVFIDGDHRASAVRADVAGALELLADGGVLAVHDFGEISCPDVTKVLASEYGHLDHEIIDTLWVHRT
jgi:predicted O-methyltransferase YrrM